MKIIYGTTNEGKLNTIRKRLSGLDIEIIGLKDLDLDIPVVEENGNMPLDNARIKALEYYKAFGMPVFSADSGLFFDNVPCELQPGVLVRRVNGKHLSDEEMIEYYSGLAKEYGDLVAKYVNAICLVVDMDNIFELMDSSNESKKFLITSVAHNKRIKGFPLDSISKTLESKKYFYDIEEKDIEENYGDDGFYKFFSNFLESYKG